MNLTGIDPSRLEARCTSIRLESPPTVHRTDLDEEGRFVLSSLEDVDYRIEIVMRADPTQIVSSADHVRPGREGLVLHADPLFLLGPDITDNGAE